MRNPLSLHMEAQGHEGSDQAYSCCVPSAVQDFMKLIDIEGDHEWSEIENFLNSHTNEALSASYTWEYEGDQQEYTFLHCAAEVGRLDVVKKMVAKGISVDIITSQGVTPLMLAARRGSWEVVQYLVGKGANVNAQDGEQSSVAHYAASNEDDDPRILGLVIQYGGKAGAIDYLGLTILSVAAGNGLESIVAYILKQDWGKKLIGIATNKKNTPLHMAIIRGYQTVAEMLIEAGAPDALNGRKKRPSDLIPRYCPAVKRRILADPPSHAGSANE